MNYAIYETTLLLGSFKEKFDSLFQDSVPDFYLNSLIEDMLTHDLTLPTRKSEAAEVQAIDVLFKTFTHPNITHKTLKKTLAKLLEADFKNLQMPLIKQIIYHPKCLKEDILMVLEVIKKNIKDLSLSYEFSFFVFQTIKNKYPDSLPLVFDVLKTNMMKVKKVNYILSIKEMVEKHNIFLSFQQEEFKNLCLEAFNSCATKDLVNVYKSNVRYGTYLSSSMTLLKQALESKEHIPSKSQTSLIRKMSVKAKKKLTLKEAQTLNNKSKNAKSRR